jgi:hypothetical protein
MAKCKKCNDARYFYPEGKPDEAGPCDKCNPDGSARPDENKRIPYGSDIFRFGHHQGKTFNEIPDSYFLWAIDQRWINDWPQVKNYIEKNFKDELS